MISYFFIVLLQTVGDNGSKISNWVLESDQGVGASMAAEGSDSDAVTFSEVYSGLQRQHKLTKLQPATRYTFRLAAVNAIGKRCVYAGRNVVNFTCKCRVNYSR